MNDDAWQMFAQLCQVVCESGDVFLDVVVSPGAYRIYANANGGGQRG